MPNNVNDFDVFSPNQFEGVYYEAPIVANRAPTVRDKYEIGKVWIDKSADDAYFITSITAGNAIWINAGGGAGTFASITATTGDITATLGDIVASAGDLILTAGSATLGGLVEGTLITSAAGVVTALADGNDGTILIGTTGGRPAWATLTAGGGITIVEAAGAITITNPGATGTTSGTDVGGPVAPTGGGLTTFEGYDLNIQTDGATANTVRIRLADDVVTVASLTATDDFDMLAGTCTIESNTNGAEAIYLHTDAGTGEQISIRVEQGTAVNSLNIASDDGGVTIYAGLASTDAININAAAGGIDVDAADQINITCTENAADAIVISASAGGIDITGTGGAGEDIDITTTASVNLVSTENAASGIYLHANGGAAETINIHSDQGTGADSININSDVGGITLTSAALAGNDAINIDATSGGVDIDAALQINLTSAQAAADSIVIDASDAAGGIDVDYGTGGMVVTGANGAFSVITGTGAINVGADAAAHTITVGNVTGATEVAVNTGTGGFNVATTGAGDITLDSDDTVLIDADGVLELNSDAGIIGIGSDADAFGINIGTGAAQRDIVIGNVTGTTSVVVDAGTGAASFGISATDHTTTVGSTTGTSATTFQAGTGAMTCTAGGAFDLNATGNVTIDSTGGTLGLGEGADAQNINIGTGAAARVVTIGNVTGATEVAVNTGTAGFNVATTGAGDITLDSADTVLIDGAGVIEINSTAGIIGIGSDADAQNINVGTGAAARVITIGNVTGATEVAVNTGTAGFNVATTGAGDITLNSADTVLIDGAGVVEINSSAGIINIGDDAVAQNINIGTGAAARTITVGNATAGTNLVLTGGNTGAVAVTPVVSSVGGVALTCSGNVGVCTFTGQTTASAAVQVLTITNTTCTVGSAIFCSLSNLGGNDAQMTVTRVTPGAGSFTVSATNNGAAALNGDIILTFWIVAA